MAAQKGDANDRIIQNELAAVWLKHNNVEIQMVRRRSERILITPFVLFVWKPDQGQKKQSPNQDVKCISIRAFWCLKFRSAKYRLSYQFADFRLWHWMNQAEIDSLLELHKNLVMNSDWVGRIYWRGMRYTGRILQSQGWFKNQRSLPEPQLQPNSRIRTKTFHFCRVSGSSNHSRKLNFRGSIAYIW